MSESTGSSRIQRFSAAERLIHWTVAGVFLYVALTGLALWSPRLFWMASVFGGGTTVRAWHPWAGFVFGAALLVMFVRWAGQMRLDAGDGQWLRQAHRYAVHDHSALPEAGRFNAGQKVLFWFQAAATVVLLASGIVLWFPESTSRALRELSVLIHPIAAIGSIAGIIVHIYMGTAAVPKALRGMIRGWVTPGWAALHHPKWYREIRK